MESEVVRYLRRKDDTGTDFESITWLGSEQRFVNALRNSSNNNLEEQYLLGTDTYTITEEDTEGNQIIKKFFYTVTDNNNPFDTNISNYYYLETTKKNDATPDYRFDNDTLKMPNKPTEVHFDTTTYTNTIAVVYEDPNSFNFNSNILQIGASNAMQEDKFYFINGTGFDGTDINSFADKVYIAKKETKVKYENNKKITREIITKYLNS